MKQFIYRVANCEFSDTEAFGKAWQEAKAKATSLHEAIYRLTIKGEKVENEVYITAGCFLRVDLALPENIKTF